MEDAAAHVVHDTTVLYDFWGLPECWSVRRSTLIGLPETNSSPCVAHATFDRQ